MRKQMETLQKWLTAHGIEWEDESDVRIKRTKFEVSGHAFSVVHGLGTYGGIDLCFNYDHGLLEMRIDDMDPEGYLTAQDIIQTIEGFQNGKTFIVDL